MRHEEIIRKIIGENVDYVPLQQGRVANTYYVKSNPASILQLWENDSGQAHKKFSILNALQERDILIPRPLQCGDYSNTAYLLTSYIEGETLATTPVEKQDDRKRILHEIGATLEKIHGVYFGSYFGWLNSHDVQATHIAIETYLRSECDRFACTLQKNIQPDFYKKMMRTLEENICSISEHGGLPVLCWYDIHPDNILIKHGNPELNLAGILDPGAARMGLPEWDLAHAWLHLCETRNDYTCIKAGYENKKIDDELVSLFIPIILADDLTLGIKRNWRWLIRETTDRLYHEVV